LYTYTVGGGVGDAVGESVGDAVGDAVRNGRKKVGGSKK
jgi:hypothetical protein